MRCKACDKVLSDSEAVNKNRWGEYEDTCFRCLKESGIAVIEDYEDEIVAEEDGPNVYTE